MKGSFIILSAFFVSLLALGKTNTRQPSLSVLNVLRTECLNAFNNLWKDVGGGGGGGGDNGGQHKLSDVDLLSVFKKLHVKITEGEKSIIPSNNYLVTSDWTYATVEGEIININTYYETFVRFQRDHSTRDDFRKPPLAWSDLARTYLQKSDFGVIKSLEKLNYYSASKIESENIFYKVYKVKEKTNFF